MSEHSEDPTIVIVGGGPRGSGLLERLAANADGSRATVHVVEPFTPGAGRVWRHDQSALLWANSQAVDMTMFTDESCTIDGPTRPGPTFLEWARRPDIQLDDEELSAERAAVHAMTFPSRPLLSAYLRWCFDRALGEARAAGLDVIVHADRAVRLTEAGDGRQLVHLAGGDVLAADVVILAQGHLDREPGGGLAALAEAQGLTYVPESFTSEVDVTALRPGQNVVVRGAGLAFVDLLVRLTQGRGGRFSSSPSGSLVYEPSGQEPRLFVGSRRGVPYHSKLTYWPLPGVAPGLRYLTEAAIASLLATDGDLDFRAQVYPLVAKELAHWHYHELFTVHGERATRPWAEFLSALDCFDLSSPSFGAVVEAAVPDPADRFSPSVLDHPLEGLELPSLEAFQEYLKTYLRGDVDRRADPAYSPDLAVFLALLAALPPLFGLIASGRLSTNSSVRDLPWFLGFFSYLASGPPPRRLEEMIALMDAGILTFLGASTSVTVGDGVFVATSASMPGSVEATALVEARIPRSSLPDTRDELLADLYRRGLVSEALLRDSSGLAVPSGQIEVTADFHLVEASGRAHPARYALGAGTGLASPGAFSRPNTDAAFFRQNDAVARQVLSLLAVKPPVHAG